MAGEFSITNVTGQGFDYQSYLDKYKQLKQIPINMMQSQIDKLKKQQEALSAISSKFSSLLTPALNLTLDSTYETKKAVLSDSNVASVSVDSSAVNASYSLEVLQLAQAEKDRVSLNGISDLNTPLSSGTFTINYRKDGNAQTLSIDYTGKTLRELVDEINKSNDIQASIINTGTSSSPNYELIITSKNIGTNNDITSITGGIVSSVSQIQAAQDAQIRIDGIAFTSQSNTFSNVITGVTITAKETTTSPVNLEIKDDYSNVKDNIKSIIENYNKLKDVIKIATSKGQPLQGEASLNTIASGALRIITSYLGKYGLIDTIGDAETTRGSLKLNESALNEFLKRDDAKQILQNLGRDLENYVNSYSDSLTLTNQKYTERMNYISKRIEYMTERINKEIESMRKRFAKLNMYLADMQSIQLRIQNFAKGLGGLSTNNK